MKTQKKTLRGIVTSSIFALSLVTGLVPVGALAYAAESAPQVINDLVQVAPGTENASDGAANSTNAADTQNNAGDANAPANTSTNNAAADANTQPSGGSDNNGAGESVDENAGNSNGESVAPALPTSGYTTINPDRISATVALNAEETVVVGDVEYEGLTYRINEDGETATLIGFGTSKPSGNLVIPSRIATTGMLYTVTNIGSTKAGGGGSLR